MAPSLMRSTAHWVRSFFDISAAVLNSPQRWKHLLPSRSHTYHTSCCGYYIRQTCYISELLLHVQSTWLWPTFSEVVAPSIQQWKKSIPNLPETANVPEDGATLQVQNGPNCAIYPIFNLNSFFRDRTFRSSKGWKSKGDVCSTKVFRGKDFFTTKLLNRWRNHLGQCHPIAGERRKEKRRKGKGKGERGKGKEKGKGEGNEKAKGQSRKGKWGKGKGKGKGEGERRKGKGQWKEEGKEKGESERDREHDFSSWNQRHL